jgi:malate dehydrogenase (oxaloacetate-decarboxylating)
LNRPLPLRGTALLNTPTENRGTAFTTEERTALGLHGLLPPDVETLEEQVTRAYEAYQRKNDDLERHIYLRALQDTNEVLFYRLLLDHIEEMTPVVYTPVVALGCQEFSHIYRRPRGLFISYPLRDSIPALLRNRPNRDVDVIVVTDGERILGIGDQGVGGLGIPIGKLSLYTLIGGIHPARTLPIVLDCGTNNPNLLKDPHYLGWRHERITGEAYYDFVNRFVEAVKQELPDTCLQWEDFATVHARPILSRYRDQLLTFNDDIQGTAAVALGALMAAVKLAGSGGLRDQRIVFLGAGAASTGVADFIRAAMIDEGLSDAEARKRFWLIDRKGVLTVDRLDALAPEQAPYARDDVPPGTILQEAVERSQATVLIGLSTVAGAFNETLIRTMAKATPRPIIMPLSNPTAKSEAKPEDLVHWTEGSAIIATGSPFQPVDHDGRQFRFSQCNNMYVFPAIGLAVVASKATRVTDGMMIAGARALAKFAPTDGSGLLLPRFHSLRDVALEIAVAAGLEAQRCGVAPQTSEEELRARVIANQWSPEYAISSLGSNHAHAGSGSEPSNGNTSPAETYIA